MVMEGACCVTDANERKSTEEPLRRKGDVSKYYIDYVYAGFLRAFKIAFTS